MWGQMEPATTRDNQYKPWRVKISPCMSQKQLRFGDDVGKREFIKFTKKYHQQLEEECASVGRITEVEEATRD